MIVPDFVDVYRVQPPDAQGRMAGYVRVLSGVMVQIDPASAAQIADVGGMVLYKSYMLYTMGPLSPDIRVTDRLVNAAETDPLKGNQPLTYIVRGVRAFELGLEMLCEVVEGA